MGAVLEVGFFIGCLLLLSLSILDLLLPWPEPVAASDQGGGS